MYKLLCLDVDGTLINNKGFISNETKNAINKIRSLGVRVVLVTGRSYQGIEKYLEELNLIGEDEYCIVSSGSVILNTTNSKIIHSDCLTKDEVLYLYDKSKEFGLFFNIHDTTSGKVYVDSLHNFSIFDAIINNMNIEEIDFKDMTDNILPTKITYINEDSTILNDMKKIFHGIELNDYITINKDNFNSNLFDDYSFLPKDFLNYYCPCKTTKYSLEISKNTVTKGHAVKKLASILNIDIKDVICVGDSGNDLEMIKVAGLGVAMENAYDEVKAAADYITSSNNDNGIVKVIDKFMLNNTSLSLSS